MFLIYANIWCYWVYRGDVMKTVKELQALLESGKTSFEPLNIIESGMINDSKDTACDYMVVKGWDIGLAMQCNDEWGAFNLDIMGVIENSPPEQEKELLGESSLEDAHWNWLKKHQCYYGAQYDWFFFLVDEVPQGACLVYHPKEAISTNENIFYIEFLAVAPWNRPNIIAKQRFKGVGSKLLKHVMCYAEDSLGINKGFSLHSLPKAEGYYKKIGMIRFPQKDKDGLGYFEMPEKQRHDFLGVAS